MSTKSPQRKPLSTLQSLQPHSSLLQCNKHQLFCHSLLIVVYVQILVGIFSHTAHAATISLNGFVSAC